MHCSVHHVILSCLLNYNLNSCVVKDHLFLNMQVSNALDELLEWYTHNAKNNLNIIHATKRCAAGIIQAIGNFCLGPNVSPRDIRDLKKCNVDISPGHEVVKFYLVYERWRRAEVDKSKQFVKDWKSVFVSVTGSNFTYLMEPSFFF